MKLLDIRKVSIMAKDFPAVSIPAEGLNEIGAKIGDKVAILIDNKKIIITSLSNLNEVLKGG